MSNSRSLLEILIVSFKLGCISFGGPIAHLGYFHEEYVRRRKWLDEESYADLVALCQFLPGPASSQVGIGIGVRRGGLLGGIISFIGFTAPSVVVLILFALLLGTFNVAEAGWIHGLKIVAVAVVAHAVLGMMGKLTPDLKRQMIALGSLAVVLLWQITFVQVAVILAAGVAGLSLYRNHAETTTSNRVRAFQLSRRVGYICLGLFFTLLILLPVASSIIAADWLILFDRFYRSGSLVFGGGHVVLPLLEQEFVSTDWLSEEGFLAGYGATQAVPGPLFTFAAYIGAVIGGWKTGLFATFAIFLPAFLLIIGTLPFWDTLRTNGKIKSALLGVNAAVVGILLAALYNPIWTSSIITPSDFVLAAILFSMLKFLKWPPWTVVLAGALGGIFL